MKKKTDIEIKLEKTKADIMKKTLKAFTEKHDQDDELKDDNSKEKDFKEEDSKEEAVEMKQVE